MFVKLFSNGMWALMLSVDRKIANLGSTVPVGHSASLVSYWNSRPTGWDFPVPTEHQWMDSVCSNCIANIENKNIKLAFRWFSSLGDTSREGILGKSNLWYKIVRWSFINSWSLLSRAFICDFSRTKVYIFVKFFRPLNENGEKDFQYH